MSDPRTVNRAITNRTLLSVCWAQPIGSGRWHSSWHGTNFDCGAFSGDRFKGNVQVMNVRLPDFPVLACLKCLSWVRRRAGKTDGRESTNG